jgi:hypothetical protein
MANTVKKFLDQTGTGYLWGKIKQQLDTKASSSDFTTLAGRVTTAEGEIDDLQALHATGKTVAQEAADAISALNLSTTYAGKAYEGKVDTLIGSDTGKSARAIAAEELAAKLIAANADASLDTLEEIAAWIQAHPGDAAAMNSAINALQTKLTLGNDGNGDEYTTVKAYMEAALNGLEQSSHAHSNKSVLDGITSTLVTNWSTAYSKAHEHSNKAVLDGITASDVTAWNAAEQNAKNYADGLASNYATAAQGALADTALQSTDVVALTSTEIDAAIASANSSGT